MGSITTATLGLANATAVNTNEALGRPVLASMGPGLYSTCVYVRVCVCACMRVSGRVQGSRRATVEVNSPKEIN